MIFQVEYMVFNGKPIKLDDLGVRLGEHPKGYVTWMVIYQSWLDLGICLGIIYGIISN